MKRLVLALACLLISLHGMAQKVMKSETQLKEKIALAYKLTDKDKIKRMNELHQTLFRKVDKAVEHPNSYELVFRKADGDLKIQLAEFIKFERLCCPWLLFQLTFQPKNGPISLKMGNSAETKEMVKLVMELDKLEKTR